MSRKDGRTAAQIRTMACEQAPLQRADGSARFDIGLLPAARASARHVRESPICPPHLDSTGCKCDNYFRMPGNTSVLAAVYGPGEVAQRRELSDRAVLEVTLKPKVAAARAQQKGYVRRRGCLVWQRRPRSCGSRRRWRPWC